MHRARTSRQIKGVNADYWGDQEKRHIIFEQKIHIIIEKSSWPKTHINFEQASRFQKGTLISDEKKHIIFDEKKHIIVEHPVYIYSVY